MSKVNRFQIIEEKFGVQTSFKIFDSLTGEYARILPYLGGSINDLYFKSNERLQNILSGYSSSEDAGQNIASSFKGSNLFPFPNRVRDGKYLHNGKEFQLELNFPQENNAIHGLIYNKEFEVLSKEESDDYCSLVIAYNPKDAMAGYPFNYSLEVAYRWDKNTHFECTSKVTNLYSEEIPVGLGWHPYFVAGDSKVDDLWVQFPAEKMLNVDKRMIPTGTSMAYSAFNTLTRVDKTEWDSCFELKTDCTPAEIVIFNKKENFGYKIWQEVGEGKYNFLQVYTPPTRNSIAIEPMTCAPDALNNKQGLILLAPGKSIEVKWGVTRIENGVSSRI